jgi:hypothetical protein
MLDLIESLESFSLGEKYLFENLFLIALFVWMM